MARRKSKAECEQCHVRRRGRERYGITISERDVYNIVRQIREGERRRALYLGRESCARTWWAVWHENRWLPVVYNKSTGQIVTVLPPEFLDQYRAEFPELETVGAIL